MPWKIIERRLGRAGAAINHPSLTLEQFWQEKKCLALWED
jgi:hypothetical protein